MPGRARGRATARPRRGARAAPATGKPSRRDSPRFRDRRIRESAAARATPHRPRRRFRKRRSRAWAASRRRPGCASRFSTPDPSGTGVRTRGFPPRRPRSPPTPAAPGRHRSAPSRRTRRGPRRRARARTRRARAQAQRRRFSSSCRHLIPARRRAASHSRERAPRRETLTNSRPAALSGRMDRSGAPRGGARGKRRYRR